MKRIVTIGGGKGQPELLRALAQYAVDLSALVCMTDNGGSSGVLRAEKGVLPPGDLRRCIAALADNEAAVLAQWEARDANNHAQGNLDIVAKTQELGDMQQAADFFMMQFAPKRFAEKHVEAVCATLDDAQLVAQFSDGTTVQGEEQIDDYELSTRAQNAMLERIWVEPHAAASARAITAIESADVIVLSMGDLYTSMIPILLIDGITQAIAQRNVPVIAICNRTTKKGETHDFTTADFARVIEQYLAPATLHTMIADNMTLAIPKTAQATRVMPLENSHVALVTADLGDAQKPAAVSGALAAREIMKLFE